MMSGLSMATAQVAGPSFAPLRRKAWTAVALPHSMALSKGRLPSKSTCSMAAPRSINNLTVSAVSSPAFELTAWSKGVLPFLSPWCTSAPASNKAAAAAVLALLAAQMSGVHPSLSLDSNKRLPPLLVRSSTSLRGLLWPLPSTVSDPEHRSGQAWPPP